MKYNIRLTGHIILIIFLSALLLTLVLFTAVSGASETGVYRWDTFASCLLCTSPFITFLGSGIYCIAVRLEFAVFMKKARGTGNSEKENKQ